MGPCIPTATVFQLSAVFQRPLYPKWPLHFNGPLYSSDSLLPTSRYIPAAAVFHLSAVFQWPLYCSDRAAAAFRLAAGLKWPLYSTWPLYSNGPLYSSGYCNGAAAVFQLAEVF
jgi:hypothetical protein